MSEREGMQGDDGTGVPSPEEMGDKILRSLADAEVLVGVFHDVVLHEEYGQMSAALPLSVLGGDGEVVSAVIWVPPDMVPTLRRVLKKLDSPDFLRHLPGALSGLRAPVERSGRPAKKRRRR